jgi:hypothetical protein
MVAPMARSSVSRSLAFDEAALIGAMHEALAHAQGNLAGSTRSFSVETKFLASRYGRKGSKPLRPLRPLREAQFS